MIDTGQGVRMTSQLRAKIRTFTDLGDEVTEAISSSAFIIPLKRAHARHGV